MNNEAMLHDATHASHHDHGHEHHEQHFITKYIFSQDHKMIAKQFLITGIILGCNWSFDVCVFPFAIRFSG
jgi:cytochrome c oxidase subunit 1